MFLSGECDSMVPALVIAAYQFIMQYHSRSCYSYSLVLLHHHHDSDEEDDEEEGAEHHGAHYYTESSFVSSGC